MIRLKAFGTSLTGSKPRASGDDPHMTALNKSVAE